MIEDDDMVFAAMRAGASGYVLKGADNDDIVRSVQAVHAGELIFGPGIAERVAAYFASRPDPAPADPAAAFPQLTPRELELLAQIASGLDNTAIARGLHLSPKTVRNNVSNIFFKLHVSHRAEAIVMGREAGVGLDRPDRPRN